MKFDDARLLARSRGMAIFDLGNNTYKLASVITGEKVGSVGPINGTSDEYFFEYDSIKINKINGPALNEFFYSRAMGTQ
jgi:hypothetical protein